MFFKFLILLLTVSLTFVIYIYNFIVDLLLLITSLKISPYYMKKMFSIAINFLYFLNDNISVLIKMLI